MMALCFLTKMRFITSFTTAWIVLLRKFATAILISAGILPNLVCVAANFPTTPIADAFVTTGPGPANSQSVSNYGAAGALAIAAPGLSQGEFQTVIKYDLSTVRNSLNAQFGANSWSIQSITLTLNSSPHNNAIFNNIATGHFDVSLMQNSSWVEGTGTGGIPTTDGISFSSLQNTYTGPSDETLSPSGGFNFPGGSSGANTYTLTFSPTLVSELQAGSDLSLRLSADAQDQVSYLFSSRQTGGGPLLTINAIPEPGVTALSGLGLLLCLLHRFRKR